MLNPREEPNQDPAQVVPETTSHFCGWCGRHAWFRRRVASWGGFEALLTAGRSEFYPRAAGIYQCGGCQNNSLLVWTTFSSGLGWKIARLEHSWPAPSAMGKEEVPDGGVEADRLEAWNSYLSEQYRASILMARSALQRAVRYLLAGPEGNLAPTDRGSLFTELDLLRDRGIITQQLRDNADEVRLSGNDVAHPEEMGKVDRAEAQDSLTFLDDFIETTLVIPARQRARRADRNGRDSGPSG